jgi:hypothetical protein
MVRFAQTVSTHLSAAALQTTSLRPKKGGTATLAISVPHIDMNLGFAAQLRAIEEALKAAYRLMPYASPPSRAGLISHPLPASHRA